jgi:hypothetical protein
MSQGKHLSLEEARKLDKIDRFCKEHPTEGDESIFDGALAVMAPKVFGKSSEGEPTTE